MHVRTAGAPVISPGVSVAYFCSRRHATNVSQSIVMSALFHPIGIDSRRSVGWRILQEGWLGTVPPRVHRGRVRDSRKGARCVSWAESS